MTRRDGGGRSGVIWKPDGLILTNAHVARASEAEVELWDGRRFPARVVSRDARRDLATLRIAATGLEAATAGRFGRAASGRAGDRGRQSAGIRGRAFHGHRAFERAERWIHADVRLAPGNSGGPLADAHGQVVGINTAIVNGLGVAVPSNAALDFLRHGRAAVRWAW